MVMPTMVRRCACAGLVLLLGAFGPTTVNAAVRLATPFGSHMVLQRDVQVKLTGYADVGEKVTVKLGGQVVGQVEGAGTSKPWTVLLPAQKAGYVVDITVEGKNTITLTNLLAGDVWICSGQSNMNMPLEPGPGFGGVLNYKQEIAAACYPRIRMIKSGGGSWQVCTPETAASFSAAGYFFARELLVRLDVPIGIVQAAVNGTMAESWTPMTARLATPGFKEKLEQAKLALPELTSRNNSLQDWKKQCAGARKEKSALPAKPEMDGDVELKLMAAHAMLGTGSLFDRLISPVTCMTIRGVIWYQGESNSRLASEYPELLKQLIGGWRQAWGLDFPFVIMQLAGFESSPVFWYHPGAFTELRAAQQAVADTVQGVGLATAIDIGAVADVHPRNKQEVGRRLALVALKQVYGCDVVASGPVPASVKFEAGRVTITFDPGGKDQQVVYNNAATNGFEVAGADGVFVQAGAGLCGNAIVLSVPGLPDPRVVRYAWADNPPATLFNTAGLPAAPFQKLADGVAAIR